MKSRGLGDVYKRQIPYKKRWRSQKVIKTLMMNHNIFPHNEQLNCIENPDRKKFSAK